MPEMRDPMKDLMVEEVKASNWEVGFQKCLEEANEVGWFSAVNDHVVIKPNLCTVASHWSGTTTDVRTVDLLVSFVRKLWPGVKISIVESDSFDRTAEEVFRRLGYEKLKEKYGVDLINLSKEEAYEVAVRKIPYPLNLPKIFLKEVFFVSIALPKCHAYQKITAVYKNQFGCIPDKWKEKYHQYLEEVLYVLNNQLMIPDLSIIDGRIGMQGYGPVSGDRIESNFIIVSKDPTLADLACAKIMGFDPRKIPYLRYSCRRKGMDPACAELEGVLPRRKFTFIPFWEYRSIRGKLKVTRVTMAMNGRGKRIVHIFFRLPSYMRDRKLIPLLKRVKARWNTVAS